MNSDLLVEKIVYITHDKDSFRVYYIFGKSYENICSYYALLKILSSSFIRVNDSTIVNFEFVSKCTDKKVSTISGETFDVSSRYQKNVTNKFFKEKLKKFNADE